MIVLVLHVLQSNYINTDCFPFYCGVPLFLIISGYLFGQEKIDNVGQWYRKRLIRVWVPYLLLFVINLSIVSVMKDVRYTSLEIMQGVFVLPSFSLGKLGLAHCWYITYILACYLIVPLLSRMRGAKILLVLVGIQLISFGSPVNPCVYPYIIDSL